MFLKSLVPSQHCLHNINTNASAWHANPSSYDSKFSFQSYLPPPPTGTLHCRQTAPVCFHHRCLFLGLLLRRPSVRFCLLNHTYSPKLISSATTSGKPFQMFPVTCALSPPSNHYSVLFILLLWHFSYSILL